MILVTGATGYIGRHLVSRLVDQGERPRCLVRNLSRAANILLAGAGKVEFVKGDPTPPASLKTAVQGIDTTVHTAFITADHKQSAGNHYEETNVQGTANLDIRFFVVIAGGLLVIGGDESGMYGGIDALHGSFQGSRRCGVSLHEFNFTGAGEQDVCRTAQVTHQAARSFALVN